MLKFIYIGLVVLFLTSCQSLIVNPLRGALGLNIDVSKASNEKLKTYSEDKIIIVGKINVSPQVTSKGSKFEKLGTRPNKPLKFEMVFVRNQEHHQAKTRKEFSKLSAREFIRVEGIESEGYFVAEIKDRDASLSLLGFNTRIKRGSTTYFSALREMLVPYSRMKAGNIYYIGNFDISLDNKSFREVRDEIYDFRRMRYLVPNALNLDFDSGSATEFIQSYIKNNDQFSFVNLSGVKIKPFLSHESNYEKITKTYVRM